MDTANFRDLAVEEFDTRTLLSHANAQAVQRKYEDFFICDVDGHHWEVYNFPQIAGVHRRPDPAPAGEIPGLWRRRHHRAHRPLSGNGRADHLAWTGVARKKSRKASSATAR